ncbi:MAG: creatininase family protein [Chloroflexi bacterium]|nr:MAG: creatininase family protein [Chloroflexota bacterium]
MNKVRLQDLTWVEAEEKLKAGVPVIVPFGSQEQHGPHAPMGDFIITEAVAIAAAERAGAIVAPVIAGGYSEYFLEDYVDCLVGQGFERIIFFNGHSGNSGTIDHTVRKIRDERSLRIPVLSILGFRTPEMMKQLFPAGGAGHGGGMMAALYLHLVPESCRMDLATAGKYHDFHGLKVTGLNTVDFKGYPIGVHFNYNEITDPTGVIGDGREATASSRARPGSWSGRRESPGGSPRRAAAFWCVRRC